MPTPPFATLADLTARGAETSDGTETLLLDASQLIIDEGYNVEKIAPATLTRIVCAMVQRAQAASPLGLGVESYSQGSSPYSATVKYSNPMGDLYLTRAERRQLSGGQQARAFSIDLLATEAAP